MARLPQYERPDDLTRDVTAVKAAVKRLAPCDRAELIAWLLLYYDDRGDLRSQRSAARRRRVTIDDQVFWLVKVPTR